MQWFHETLTKNQCLIILKCTHFVKILISIIRQIMLFTGHGETINQCENYIFMWNIFEPFFIHFYYDMYHFKTSVILIYVCGNMMITISGITSARLNECRLGFFGIDHMIILQECLAQHNWKLDRLTQATSQRHKNLWEQKLTLQCITCFNQAEDGKGSIWTVILNTFPTCHKNVMYGDYNGLLT